MTAIRGFPESTALCVHPNTRIWNGNNNRLTLTQESGKGIIVLSCDTGIWNGSLEWESTSLHLPHASGKCH